MTWCGQSWGFDSITIANELDRTIDVTRAFSNDAAFAALRAHGSPVTWEMSDTGIETAHMIRK